MKYLLFFFMLLSAASWGCDYPKYHYYATQTMHNNDTMPYIAIDTTKFYPVIDTTEFEKKEIRTQQQCGHTERGTLMKTTITYRWVPILDTIWKPKIQVYLTPEEWEKLQELLHPDNSLKGWIETGTGDAIVTMPHAPDPVPCPYPLF